MYINWEYLIELTLSDNRKLKVTRAESVKITQELYYPEKRFEICLGDAFGRMLAKDSGVGLRGSVVCVWFGYGGHMELLAQGDVMRMTTERGVLKLICRGTCYNVLKERCFDGVSVLGERITYRTWLGELTGYEVETHILDLETDRLRVNPMNVYNLLLELQREMLYVVEQTDGERCWLELFDTDSDYSKRDVRKIELTRYDKDVLKLNDMALKKSLSWHGLNVPCGVKLTGITRENRVYVKEKRDNNFTGFSKQKRVYVDDADELKELCDYEFERMHWSGYSGYVELLGVPLVKVGDLVELSEDGRFAGSYMIDKVVFTMINSRVRQRLYLCTTIEPPQ